jgi:DNA polymerase-3 subunit delta'
MIQLPESSMNRLKELNALYLQDRLPHALMFHGHDGGSALPLALGLAQFIHCTSQQKQEQACGQCESCHKYQSLVHPDLYLSFPISGAKETCEMHLEGFRKAFLEQPFMELKTWLEMEFKDENKQGNINRLESRRMISRLGLKPFESDTKIQLIWMPELLGEVGNALLKVIEEPPHKTYFLLVGNQPDRVLGTILSRTQTIKVPNASYSEIEAMLIERGCLPDQAAQIAYLCEGNLNLAFEMSQDRHADYTTLIRDWMRSCFSMKHADMQAWVQQNANLGREQLKTLLKHALQVFRECLQLISVPGYEPKMDPTQKEFIINFSKTLDYELISSIYHDVNKAVYHIERNANAKILLLDLSLGIKNHFRKKQLSQKAK